MKRGFCLFDTAIGTCGIVWTERGVAGVQLPEGSPEKTRSRIRSRFRVDDEGPPPRMVSRAIREMKALLEGKARALDGVTLDLDRVPPFHREVYAAARTIPAGTTLSYGEIASRIGKPGAARAVGQALGRNPFAIVVPCHRVLAAGGGVGGFSADGGARTKLRMLEIEGAPLPSSRPPATVRAGAPAPVTKVRPAPARFDPALALSHLRRQDPALGRLIRRVGPYALEQKRTHSLFLALAEAITHQQLNGKAAATIFSRFVALFPGRPGPTPERLLALPDEQLRSAGLSRSKALSLRDLSERSVRGELPTLAQARRLDDDALVERLTQVRGIGRWTVEMLLMFRLGRTDVLPVDDFGVRKGYAVAFGLPEMPTPRELAALGARWAPYRTVASWYLWRAAAMGPATGSG